MNASEKNPEIEETIPQIPEDAPEEKENDEPPFDIETKDTAAEGTDTDETAAAPDYASLAREDMRELISLFPHLRGKESVLELENPLRYAALRDLGLTPKEAYLATGSYHPRYDNRSHLRSAVPRAAAASDDMLDSRGLEACRELFAGLSDREIQRLYKKVSK